MFGVSRKRIYAVGGAMMAQPAAMPSAPEGGLDVEGQIRDGVMAFMQSQDPAIAVEVVTMLAEMLGVAPQIDPFAGQAGAMPIEDPMGGMAPEGGMPMAANGMRFYRKGGKIAKFNGGGKTDSKKKDSAERSDPFSPKATLRRSGYAQGWDAVKKDGKTTTFVAENHKAFANFMPQASQAPNNAIEDQLIKRGDELPPAAYGGKMVKQVMDFGDGVDNVKLGTIDWPRLDAQYAHSGSGTQTEAYQFDYTAPEKKELTFKDRPLPGLGKPTLEKPKYFDIAQPTSYSDGPAKGKKLPVSANTQKQLSLNTKVQRVKALNNLAKKAKTNINKEFEGKS